MRTYTIPKGTEIYRGKLYQEGHDDEGLMVGGWHTFYTDREVTYTDEDLRVKQKVTGDEYYEFNLPEKAEPYGVLAVNGKLVLVKEEGWEAPWILEDTGRRRSDNQ
ncbi:hypothetical protein LCGC14_2298150 [marine sediment metagenome]|uniref:Uncharacterized protein n=1 Tax=marine sediment metagenome TaxID=412755 RepID=A0A0F9F1N4_9ZZZZ